VVRLHGRGSAGLCGVEHPGFSRRVADGRADGARRSPRRELDAVLVQDLGLVRLDSGGLSGSGDPRQHADDADQRGEHPGGRAELGVQRVVLARELSIDEIRKIRPHTASAAGGVRPRRFVRRLLGPMPDQRIARRAERQPRPMCAGLPVAVRVDLRRPGRGFGPGRQVPAQSAGSGRVRVAARVAGCGSHVVQDRRPLENARVRGQHHAALPRALDAALAGRPVEVSPRDVEEMELSFSRGFSPAGSRAAITSSWSRQIAAELCLPALRAARGEPLSDEAVKTSDSSSTSPALHVLVRSLGQLHDALAASCVSLYADFADIREYREAVQMAHAAGATIGLATPRIQKPDELGIFHALAKHGADAILVRNLAGLRFYRERGLPVVADFSLNAANELTAAIPPRRGRGAGHAVVRSQPRSARRSGSRAVPPAWLEVVVHQHMPMFHMEHCVFCAVLSPGTNKTNCGRPCDLHTVKLRDRIGMEHPLTADVGCRNTLFNATPQSGAEIVPRLAAGVRHFRDRAARNAGRRRFAARSPSTATLLAGAKSPAAKSGPACKRRQPRRRDPRHARRAPQPAGDFVGARLGAGLSLSFFILPD
jgi:hypothetical protein